MSDHFTETASKGFFSRVGNSPLGLGPLLVIGAIVLLSWNPCGSGHRWPQGGRKPCGVSPVLHAFLGIATLWLLTSLVTIGYSVC
jgi:hypothetical protein